MTKIGGKMRVSVLLLLVLMLAVPFVFAADISREAAAKYILATAKAFRSVYVKQIVDQAKKAGVKPNENWTKDDHAIMLPAQFVKAAGAELKDFELGLIGLTPIYKANLPKTEAEANALKKMLADPKVTVVTFEDGKQFKGLAADFAIVQSCADCHNAHPDSAKKDFKQGDLMGAIVVRFSK
ncbi:MAG: c-type heme family protein [Nitrospiraceae bacterium]